MKAIILAGGKGTRLRPLTEEIPKPLVPFLGEPLIVRIIRQLTDLGIHEITLTLGHRGDQIQAAVQTHTFDSACHLHFSQEETPLGTAGSVLHCRDFVDEDTLIISGDCVIETDLQGFITSFYRQKSLVSILATAVADPREFGTILTDDQGYVRGFVEKPMWDQVRTDLVSTGIYLIKPALMSILAAFERMPLDFAHDVFPRMLTEHQPIHVHEMRGYWCDIGSPEAYLQAYRTVVGEHEDFTVQWQDVSVGQGSVVRGCVLCDGVRVGKNVILQNTFIGPYTVIEDHACVVNGFVDGHMRIAQGTALHGYITKSNQKQYERAPVGERDLVGDFTHAFISKLCGAIAMFFEVASTVAVVTQQHNKAVAVGKAMEAGLLTCGREIKVGSGISLPAMRWMIRKGLCDGGVYITEDAIRLLNHHGNDLSRSERRRFQGIYTKDAPLSPVRQFYGCETIQNPEEYYYVDLINRFPCAHRMLDYFGKQYTPAERNGLIAKIVLALYPEAPIFVAQHHGLLAEQSAKEADRYIVYCGDKIGDVMAEMEQFMHIPGVYEQYLMFADDFALELALCTLQDQQAMPELQPVYTHARGIHCPMHQCAHIIRRFSKSEAGENSGENGLVFRYDRGNVHLAADEAHESIHLYVESFNEEYSQELLVDFVKKIESYIK